jgi:capsid protein
MPEWTRDEINAKANWLYNNLPHVRMVIDGLTLDEVDTGLWPKATTSDPVFNKLATDAFHEQNKDPRFFHASANENFYSAQWMIRRSIRLYGELFGQFLRPGEDLAVPTMHFVNTWQCGNATTTQDQGYWKDGVMRNARQRPLKYRFLTNKERSRWEDVPADDVRHFHDQFWQGQCRGMSCLAPVAQRLFKFDDIERAEANGLILRNRMAYTIERKDQNDDGPVIMPGAQKVEEIENEDGSKVLIQRVIQRDADSLDIADVPAGYKMSVLESNRPNVTVEWQKWTLAGVASSTLYPSEYVFNLAGLGQGTLVRLVQKRVQRVKNTVRQFQLTTQFVEPWYRFWLWQRIASGAFPSVPSDWWKCKIIYPADDTVDVGREGKLFDDRVDSGKMSPATYHGYNGEDDEDVEDEVMRTRIRRLKKLQAQREANPDLADQITYESIFAKNQSGGKLIKPLYKNDDPEDSETDPEDDENPEKK